MKSAQDKKKKGQFAENLAFAFLSKKGYRLNTRNYRYKRSEIDLIMQSGSILVFVEVKYRNSSLYGHPEEFVSDNQKRSIIEGAGHYINEIDWSDNIRFDIIAIDAKMKIEHFKDAFY